MPDLLDMIDNLDIQEEKQPENLHPPPKPTITKKNKSDEINKITEFKIDWLKVAQSSDFKRAVYLALEGKVWRGKDADLEKELNKKIQIFRDPSFSNVIKELEEHFKNGFVKPSQMN